MKKKKTIVFLGFNDPKVTIRGTERVILNQAQAVPGIHYYVYRGNNIKVTKWGKLIAVSVPRNLIKCFININILLIKLSIRRDILVHGHSYILSALVVFGPLIFTIHDSLAYLNKEMNRNFIVIYKAIEIFVYFKSKGIHCISKYCLDNTWCNKLIRNKSIIIFNTTTIINNKKNNINNNKINKFILIVKSIEERANIDVIIKFAKLLKEREPDKKINIAGKGPLLNYYKSLCNIEKIENINFLGFVNDDDLIDLYRQAICIIVPAKYGEGFGLPVIEAYSMRKLVFASNVCALPEIIFDKKYLFENEEDLLTKYLNKDLSDISKIENYFNKKFKSEIITRQYRMYYDKFFKIV